MHNECSQNHQSLTYFIHNECQLGWCCYHNQKSLYISSVSRTMYVYWNGVAIRSTCPRVSVTMTPFMIAVNAPWCRVAMRDHQSVSVQSQFRAYSNVCWMALPARMDHQSTAISLIHNDLYTHTHTHQVYNVKWCYHQRSRSQSKVTLHIAGHCHLTPTIRPDDSLMHAVNP